MNAIRATLRDLRYALPGMAGRLLPSPGHHAAARICKGLRNRGHAVTVGYFQGDDAAPAEIVEANLSAASLIAALGSEAYLSVKAPPLGFDAATLYAMGAKAGMPLLFDAHAPKDAEATHELVRALQGDFPGTGLVIPARWRRSVGDAAAFRDRPGRIRLVKGEWADPDWDGDSIEDRYVELAGMLAGRAAPVSVATHDPDLARRALARLVASCTPCELEQLRGLPRRRTVAIARELGVPVRVYVPFGPGWWPYAIDKALARPYLPAWWLRDTFGRVPSPGRTAPSARAAS